MKLVLIVLVVALIAKDTSQLNDPYIMRGVAQSICLVVGGVWVVGNLSGRLLSRYWPVWGYLAALILSAGWNAAPFYVWLQFASLAAVLLFYVAYFEANAKQEDSGVGLLLDAVTALYALVAALSLLVMFTHPKIAYGAVDNGLAGTEFRFRGLFPKAGMLASAAGFTIGAAWFARRSALLKATVIAVCGVCLALTQARTLWVALPTGILAVYAMDRHTGTKWLRLGFGLFVVALLWLGVKAFDVTLDVSQARFLRTESLTSLTGRALLWQEGLKAFYRQPVLGYGYTAGASGLMSSSGRAASDEAGIDSTRDLGKTTLHSGYLQSLLDSGIVGTIFYLAIIAVPLVRLARHRLATPRDRAVFFGLVFFAVANAGQNVIYSASVFDSLLFFGLAIYAMAPRRQHGGSQMAVARAPSTRIVKAGPVAPKIPFAPERHARHYRRAE
jgi:O-Antigen ligase